LHLSMHLDGEGTYGEMRVFFGLPGEVVGCPIRRKPVKLWEVAPYL